MQKIKCYLAGGFVSFGKYPDWRDYIKEELSDLMDFYDPRTDTNQTSISTFVYEDLAGVESCDLVFYFVTSIGDVGASIECERAHSRNKLVVLCVKAPGVTIVHPFLIGIARRFFIGIDTGVTYLKNLTELGLDNEFQAIYKTMGRK